MHELLAGGYTASTGHEWAWKKVKDVLDHGAPGSYTQAYA